MDLNERIELEQQTVTALCAIRDNGGNVPDGYVLEANSFGNWDSVDDPSFGSIFYRLTPIKPPRFTVSTDPCGVLDSEQCSIYCPCMDAAHAARVCSLMNSGDTRGFAWSELPKPQIPLGRGDVPPNSVFRDKNAHEDNWIACGGVDETGALLGRSYVLWGELKERFLILRPGCSNWLACSKDAT
jgi:hypothetical protein